MNQLQHLQVSPLTHEQYDWVLRAIPELEDLLVRYGRLEVSRDQYLSSRACNRFAASFKLVLTKTLRSGIITIAPARVLQAYTLPVPDPPYILVPVAGNGRVGGMRAEPGSYVILMEDVVLEPEFLFMVMKAGE
ncbi:hypothetical protein NKR23_g1601 [Pleurostoma richardsiae]|uniref:Uncharacterized protein n=1 Tax=Pleurostoma richardsiae TaxID=41990 RepID=A0AA38VYI6_9PEZI|nr:hypothetical protein NKR23_g1601 [Pleurostoma richardsiae]